MTDDREPTSYPRDNRVHDGWRMPVTERARSAIIEARKLIEAREQRRRARRPADRATFERAAIAVVCDAIRHTLAGERGGIAIPRNKAVLSRRTRYSPPSHFKALPTLLDNAADAGLLQLTDGDYFKRLQCTFRGGPELRGLISRYGLTFADFGHDPAEECVVLRGEKRRERGKAKAELIGYADDATTQRLRAEMRALNGWLHAADIALVERAASEFGHIDIGDRRLRRVFNNGRWDHGGRLGGGWWSAMPAATRLACIRISGERVVSLDFDSLFVRLAYASCGLLPPSGDLYSIPGLEAHRRGIKKLVSALLFDRGSRSNKPHGSIFQLPARPIAELIAAIKEAHAPVAHLFGTGVGYELMHTESNILVHALLELQARGVVALPVHDSVMAAESSESIGREVLQMAAEAECGFRLPVSSSRTD